MQKSIPTIKDPNNRATRITQAVASAILAVLVLASCSDSGNSPPPPPQVPFLDMVDVPGGVYQRVNAEPDDLTKVDAFRIGRYEVTQAQYMNVTGKPNPSLNVPPNVIGEDTNRPVDMVSWFDALVFCNLLSLREGLEPVYSILGSTTPADWGAVPTSQAHANYAAWKAVIADWSADGYRLPTEAEWMWADIGATQGEGTWEAGVFRDGWRKFYSGDLTPTYMPDNAPGDYAWYADTSGSLGSGHADYGTHEVGAKLPNELSLYDMSGNLSEWCWDIGAAYPSGYLDNPSGASTGDYFIFRGGSWMSDDMSLLAAHRSDAQLACSSFTTIGFRVARRP